MQTISAKRSNYSKINSHFSEQKLIFPLTCRGLASELNNLCLAILFCLHKKIQFELYSAFWNAGRWNVFFNSFCKDDTGLVRAPDLVYGGGNKLDKLLYIYFRLLKRKAIVLNREMWNEMRSKEFLSRHFYFPELGIDGSIFEAKRNIMEIICDPNSDTATFIYKGVGHDLDRLHNSIGLHVRRGDKLIKEAEMKGISEYVEAAITRHPNINDFFIASDSHKVIEEFKQKYPQFSFFTFCREDSFGHEQRLFNRMTRSERKTMTLEALRDIVLLSKCKAFVGTYSSNVGRLVCLLRNNTHSYSVDSEWYAS